MGEIVLVIFALLGVLAVALLAVGVLTQRRWPTYIGLTSLCALVVAWTIGAYAALGSVLVVTFVWLLHSAAKRRHA